MPRAGLIALMGRAPAEGPPGGELILTYHGHATDDASSTEYTFLGMDIGPPSPDRRVIVMGMSRTTASAILGVTVGGIACDIHTNPSASLHQSGITSAVVPTGTTADIVLTLNGNASRAGIAVYAITGGPSTVGDTDQSTGINPVTLSVTPDDGGVVAAISYAQHSSGPVPTWTGITEDDRFITELESIVASVVSDPSPTGTVNAECLWSPHSLNSSTAVAFNPA